MYLYPRLFIVADIFMVIIVSALPWYLPLQMLFFRSMHLQFTFLWTCRYFSACLACIIASASCLFYGLRILPSQILHLHPTFSMTWGCFTSKLCILNVLFQCLADASCRNFTSSIPENSLAQISSLNILWVLFSSRRPPRKKRLCTPAQLRRASPTPIRWIA